VFKLVLLPRPSIQKTQLRAGKQWRELLRFNQELRVTVRGNLTLESATAQEQYGQKPFGYPHGILLMGLPIGDCPAEAGRLRKPGDELRHCQISDRQAAIA
jgi:hypothetical protein